MRDQRSDTPEPWFRAKLYGYGAGLPFKWQGWALLGSYLLLLFGIGKLTEYGNAPMRILAFALLIAATATLLVICHQRTEGGWRWGRGV